MKLIWTETIGVPRYSSSSQRLPLLGADKDSIALSVRLNASLALVLSQAPTCALLCADERVFGRDASTHPLVDPNRRSPLSEREQAYR